MEAIADVNVLLALADVDHQHHPLFKKWFNKQSRGFKLLICRTTQMGLIRLLVSASVMDYRVLTLPQAWSFYGELVQNPSIFEANEPSNIQVKWAELCLDYGSSPKVVTDAYLAAFAIAGGLKLVSLDKGFRKFEGLDLIEP